MSQKISFLAQFWPFLTTSIKTVAYLIHHLVRHHWSKFQSKLKTFLGVLGPLTKMGEDLPPPLKSYFSMDVSLKIHFRVLLQSIQSFFGPDTPRILSGALSSGPKSTHKWPKMTASRGMKIWRLKTADSISIKLAWYVYHLNIFHLLKSDGVNLRATESISKQNKKIKTYQFILTLMSLKNSFTKCYKAGDFPMYSINLQQRYWTCGRRRRAAFVSWCLNTDIWTFLKLMIMIEHIKIMQMLYLEIW